MRALMIGWLLLLPTLAVAEDGDRQAQAKRAAMYVEARRPDAARAIYQTLLNSNPEGWEKAILYYNLGVLDMLQERWEAALQKFDRVDLAQDAPEWLLERLETNRVIALMGQMQEILDNVLPDSHYPNEVIDQLQQLDARAKVAIRRIQRTDCEEDSCEPSTGLNALSSGLQSIETRIEAEYQAQRVALDARLAILNALFLKSYPASESAIHKMANLRLEYAQAVGEELSLATLKTIQQDYPRLIQSQSSAVAERLLQARTIHEYGMQVLSREDPKTARILFRLASSWVDLAMQALPAQEVIEPSTWLELLISLQESINGNTHEAQTLLMTSTLPSKTLMAILLRTQTASLEMAEPFLASVMQVQNKGYAAHACQDVPWSQALPNFFEGYAQAAIAKQGLTLAIPPWSAIRDGQQRAVSLWRRALRKLLHPESAETEAKADQQEASNVPKQLPLSDAVRYLQQMESEDRPEKTVEDSGVYHAW